MEKVEDVLFASNIEGLVPRQMKQYVTHFMCLKGSCSFLWHGVRTEFREGDLLIVRKGIFITAL